MTPHMVPCARSPARYAKARPGGLPARDAAPRTPNWWPTGGPNPLARERLDGAAAASDIERAVAEDVDPARQLRGLPRAVSGLAPVGALARVRCGRHGHRSGALRPTRGRSLPR